MMARARRLLWLTKTLGRGGAERLLVDCASLIDRDRFDIEVAYVLAAEDALVPELRAASVPVHCLARGDQADLTWVLNLRRLVSRRRYDLVHTHAPLPAAVARIVLARPRPKMVHTEHNLWTRYHRATYWANALTYSRNDHVVAVSEAVAASIDPRRTRRGGQETPIEVLHHGIKLSAADSDDQARLTARRELQLPPHVPVVGTVGNLTAKKDQACLLNAFHLLRARWPDARLVIIGAGVLEDQLRRQSRSLGDDDRTIFTGSRPDVEALLPAFDVFALTSQFEGLPISLLEAMAAGIPAVVSPVGGITEVVTDGLEGWFAPVGDARAFADRLSQMFSDPDLRQSMGATARKRSEEFDITPAVRRLEQIYDEVLL